MWRSAGRFDPSKGGALKWMLLASRSRSIDLLRSRGGRERERPIDSGGALVDPSCGPEEARLRTEQEARTRAAVAALPQRQREVIEIAYFRGLTYLEVAETLGIPVGTVKTRMRAGFSNLRQQLSPLEEAG